MTNAIPTGRRFPFAISLSVFSAVMLAFALVLPSSSDAQDQVLRLGVLGPLTGDLAFGGEFQLKGARLKAEELNAAQDNVQIEIIAEDDESKCDRSVAAARKLLTRDNVHALLGAWQSTCTLAIVPITAAQKIPQYTTSIAAPITQQGSEWIFRVGIQTKRLNEATVSYAIEELGLTKFAIFSSNEEVGKSFAETSEEVMKEHGLKPVAKEEYARGDKDFSGQLGRIKAAGAEAMLIGTGFQEQAIIARQADELNMDIQLLGGDTLGGNAKFVKLGGKHLEGMIFATVFLPDASDERLKPFMEGYQAKYNEMPDPWAGQFYDAVGLIYEAVKANDFVIDPQQIGEYTRKMTSPDNSYSGIMGDIYFDETGDGAWDPIIGQIVEAEEIGPQTWKVLGR